MNANITHEKAPERLMNKPNLGILWAKIPDYAWNGYQNVILAPSHHHRRVAHDAVHVSKSSFDYNP